MKICLAQKRELKIDSEKLSMWFLKLYNKMKSLRERKKNKAKTKIRGNTKI